MSRVKRKQLPQDGTVLLRPNALKFNLALLDQSLARDSLAEFVRQAWHIVEPATPLLLDPWREFHDLVLDARRFQFPKDELPGHGDDCRNSLGRAGNGHEDHGNLGKPDLLDLQIAHLKWGVGQ